MYILQHYIKNLDDDELMGVDLSNKWKQSVEFA